MIKSLIEKIVKKEHMTFEESYAIMQEIMKGALNTSHLAGLLIALKVKGEAAHEVAGFATAMRDAGIKVASKKEETIDVCGTGGDYSGSFNISTASSFVVASLGIKVAKHGNRSISSKSGSADVLQALGFDISLPPEKAAEALEKIGIAFLFAPDYHPAMKYAAPVRKELGLKTIFNMLGPLTNPAGVTKQLIGTYNSEAAKIMCEAAPRLGYQRVCFVCAEDSLDEISLDKPTTVFEFDEQKGTNKYIITHDTFKYPHVPSKDILGGSAEENAIILQHVLTAKEKSAVYYTVAANAAMALYTARFSDNLIACKEAAEESIMGGKAYNKLCELRDFTA